MGAPAETEALERSEQKRQEALDRIERAREYQYLNNIEGAQAEVTDAWYCLDEALSICPSNHRARFLLVSCAMNADDYQRAKLEAMRIYQDLSSDQLRTMNDSVLHLSIAHASKMLGQTEDAIRFAQEATQLYSEDPQPYMVLGELYESMGRDQEAEQKCRQALMHNDSPKCQHQLNEQNVFFTLCCLGSCLVKQGKYTEAEMFISRGIKLDPSSTLGHRHLVDVYHYQGRLQEALRTAEKVRDMDPQDPEIYQTIEVLRQDIECGETSSQSRSARSLPRRQRDVPGGEQLSADALTVPKPASLHNQRAVGNVARTMSQQGSRRGVPTLSEHSATRGAVGGPQAAGRGDGKDSKKEAQRKQDGDWWAICCVDR